jgi:hypothetical protein
MIAFLLMEITEQKFMLVMTTMSSNNTTQTNNEILKVMMRKPQTLKQGN